MSTNETITGYDHAPWIKMPLHELTTPLPGRLVVGARWWAVTPDKCVLFYKTHTSPQCNVDRRIMERLRPELDLQFIELAYVPHRCGDYA